MKFYTIGYGGRHPNDFIKLLKNYPIKTVVDIRLRPDRASMGVYVKAKMPDKGIQNLIEQAGIHYVSLIELGNLFLNYDDWRERYQLSLERTGDLLIESLKLVESPFALLCAEKKVADCHRLQLAEHLKRFGYELVAHLE